jgi:hypothetical protein
VTQRWVRGEISNFQYLMHLNTLAGRSYNDLMQYPVFPWILADYESEELELSHPATFRDFSRPMGAQSAERLEQFKKRYLADAEKFYVYLCMNSFTANSILYFLFSISSFFPDLDSQGLLIPLLVVYQLPIFS